MHKLVSRSLAVFITLLILPAISQAQNSYQVEYAATFLRDKWTTDKQESIILSAEIFFDEVGAGSHPYAEAAFLEHTSSFGIAYIDSEFSSTSLDSDETGVLFLVNYVEPNSLLILQAGYISADVDININKGSDGTAQADAIVIGIGKYINDRSAVIVNYTQQDTDISIAPSPTATVKNTIISTEYKLVEKLQDDATFNFETSIASSKVDFNTTIETNTIIEFSGDYYHNQSTSFGISLELNSGDNKRDEGKTLGLNINMFLTPTFAVRADFNQFSADNISGEDSDEIVLSGIARF